MKSQRSGWIAGVNHGSHDASAVLLHDGRLVVWVEQERLSRTKHALGEAPADALRAALDHAGLELDDLDAVALGSDHDRLAEWLGLDAQARARILPYDRPDRLFPTALFGDCRPGRVISIPHHEAHAASAWYPSGFEQAGSLVMDAMGEDSSTTIHSCTPQGMAPCARWGVEDSLGFFYEAAALYAGFTRHQTGKLMGLASYGNPVQPMPIRPDPTGHGRIWDFPGLAETARHGGRAGIDAREVALLRHFALTCFPHARRTSDEVMGWKDFAASAQVALEAVILDLARQASVAAGSRSLVLSGGVALNCTANGVLSRSGVIDDLFVQPASTDSGVAFGAALVAAREAMGDRFPREPMTHAYWGLEANPTDIRRTLEAEGLAYRELDPPALCAAVADVIARDGVVAWHQGRAEIGPRALGARSILGNPRGRATLARINKIKGRELWRPLAPSIRREAFADCFEGLPNPFMLVQAIVRPDRRSQLAAVTHVDGTARPQVVEAGTAPLFHRLLGEVEQRTGTLVVLNTSLNGPEEPICHTPAQTLRLFRRTDIDALAIGRFLVERPDRGRQADPSGTAAVEVSAAAQAAGALL